MERVGGGVFYGWLGGGVIGVVYWLFFWLEIWILIREVKWCFGGVNLDLEVEMGLSV